MEAGQIDKKEIAQGVLDLRGCGPIGFVDGRPAMNADQEAMALAMVQSRSYKDAYMLAFPERGWGKRECYVLANNPLVRARVKTLQDEVASAGLWTRYKAINALAGVVDSNPGSPAIVGAVRELNEMHGFSEPARLEVGGPGAFAVAVRIVDPVVPVQAQPVSLADD